MPTKAWLICGLTLAFAIAAKWPDGAPGKPGCIWHTGSGFALQHPKGTFGRIVLGAIELSSSHVRGRSIPPPSRSHDAAGEPEPTHVPSAKPHHGKARSGRHYPAPDLAADYRGDSVSRRNTVRFEWEALQYPAQPAFSSPVRDAAWIVADGKRIAIVMTGSLLDEKPQRRPFVPGGDGWGRPVAGRLRSCRQEVGRRADASPGSRCIVTIRIQACGKVPA